MRTMLMTMLLAAAVAAGTAAGAEKAASADGKVVAALEITPDTPRAEAYRGTP